MPNLLVEIPETILDDLKGTKIYVGQDLFNLLEGYLDKVLDMSLDFDEHEVSEGIETYFRHMIHLAKENKE